LRAEALATLTVANEQFGNISLRAGHEQIGYPVNGNIADNPVIGLGNVNRVTTVSEAKLQFRPDAASRIID
jgi:hypothetical protein